MQTSRHGYTANVFAELLGTEPGDSRRARRQWTTRQLLMSGLRTCLVLALASVTVVARADQFDGHRVPCTNQQRAVVAQAIADTQLLLKDAIANLPPVNSTAGAKFTRWFGGPEGDNDPKLKAMYIDLAAFLPINQFWCPNASFPVDNPHALAFVPRGCDG